MRVALRRLRATLRAFRPLLDRSGTEPLRAELRWLSDLLGPVRDGDVPAQRLAEAVAAEPPELVIGPVAARIRQRLAATAARARADLVEGISSDRFSSLVAAGGGRGRVGSGRRIRETTSPPGPRQRAARGPAARRSHVGPE
jgi:CHAD domain-containing protein